MFGFIATLKKTYQNIVATITGKSITEADYDAIKKNLLEADIGPTITQKIIAFLRNQAPSTDANQTQKILGDYLEKLLCTAPHKPLKQVIMLVGINGSGKTSAAAKLAFNLISEGKKVLLVAADTFRAAGTTQLAALAHTHHIPIISGNQGQDPASVVYQACDHCVTNHYDHIIIDTAGRVHTNEQLRAELAKIKRIIDKKIGTDQSSTLLVIDTMLGQSSLTQATLFNKSLAIDSILMTKTDGKAKGGIIFPISQELALPIAYVTHGESIDAIAPFNAQAFVQSIIREDA